MIVAKVTVYEVSYDNIKFWLDFCYSFVYKNITNIFSKNNKTMCEIHFFFFYLFKILILFNPRASLESS